MRDYTLAREHILGCGEQREQWVSCGRREESEGLAVRWPLIRVGIVSPSWWFIFISGG